VLETALTDHWLPDAARAWLEFAAKAGPVEVRETANTADGFDLTTFHSPGFALGTASRTYGIGQDDFYIEHHANYLMLHYARPAERGGWGMMYTRYVLNDQHWGTKGAAPDRSKTSNFYDYGNFAGVQSRGKAIGLYALQAQAEETFSLKAMTVFPLVDSLEEIWLNDRRVMPADLPVAVSVNDWLIVTDGQVRVGVHVLEPTRLGREAPIVLERGTQGELWLTAYNYRGAPKHFWDYASLRGAFWRGNLRAGFIVEVAERDAFDTAAAFLAHLRKAQVEDAVDAERVRTVRYASGGDDIELRYDLQRTEPGERRINGAVYDPPQLSSPIAAQSSDGRVTVGATTLETDAGPAWLIAQELDPATRQWVAVNPLERARPLRLSTPVGVIAADAFPLGRLEVLAPVGGQVTVILDAIVPPVGLTVPPGVAVVTRERSSQ
jgi:hypothetical protein